MPLPLFLLILSLELLVAISIWAPTSLPGRFASRPQFGLAVWLLSFAAALFTGATALAAAVWIAVTEYASLTETALYDTNLMQVLAVSFAPWLLLGLTGVFLAFANRRLQLPTQNQAELMSQLSVSSRQFEWQGVQVLVLPLTPPIAGAIRGTILISETVDGMAPQLREAVLWHELAHIRLRHSAIRTVTRLVTRLLPGIAVARAMRSEVDRLCELAADSWVGRNFDAAAVQAARNQFQEFFPTSER